MLVDYRDAMNRLLDDEQRARRQFRDRLEDGVRREFINGEVIEHMSSRDIHHIVCLDNLHVLILTFVRLRKLGAVRREQALTEFPRNDYCPDICFWNNDHDIGDDPQQRVYPPPSMIVEVLSPSTERRDRGDKFTDFEAHDVQEYWIVDPELRLIEQYVAGSGGYQQVAANADGCIHSVAIPGLVIPVTAAFNEDVQLETLESILAGK